MERLKSKPFEIVGINSDKDRAKTLDLMKKNGVTWRNVLEGGTDGPLASRWNVIGWPTTYVLDSKGVIRYRNVRGAALDAATDDLLRELAK